MQPERAGCLVVPATVTVSLLTGALAGWFFTKPELPQPGTTQHTQASRITRKMMADVGAKDRDMMQKIMDAKAIEDRLK